MANNSLKVSELPQASNVSGTDRVMVLYSPASNPSVRTITVANLALAIGGAGSANLTAVNSHILPAVGNTFNLGASNGYAWANVFVSKHIRYNTDGDEEYPSLTGDRNGEKIILRDKYNQNLFSYSVGIGSNSMWFGIDEVGSNATGYTWYSGNTQLMKLGRDGHLTIPEIHTRRDTLEDHFHLKTGTSLQNDWVFTNTGILELPANGDIYLNGVSVLGTGQIDGGNAFTTPTAEITVDGGGA